MLIYQSFDLLYYALNRGQNESHKKALLIQKLRLFCECFGNSIIEFSFPSNLNFNLVSKIQDRKFYLQLSYLLLISFLHLFHIFKGHLL